MKLSTKLIIASLVQLTTVSIVLSMFYPIATTVLISLWVLITSSMPLFIIFDKDLEKEENKEHEAYLRSLSV